MFYLVKTPWWLKKIYPGLVWQMPAEEKTIYLSFDDGPHPEITPFVLEQLKRYDARATFFCIGKNVNEYPQIYRQILMEGHRVGNHTQNHLNGWKVGDDRYIANVLEAAKYIDSDLFRPPYGRIGALQSRLLREAPYNYKIVMWEVLSGDFDLSLNAQQCAENVTRRARAGSIVVFHDSEKAFDRLKDALPLVLEYFAGKGYKFAAIQ
jgi:peptidoglycan/xylan/chitin deacetylase (PgdA/CDA1 family)